MSTIRRLFSKPFLVRSTIGGTAGEDGIFRFRRIYKNPELFPRLIALLQPNKYHGTSLEQLGEQIDKGEFEDWGKRVYFHSIKTAARYASRRQEGWGNHEELPVVVRIVSWQLANCNSMGGGFYSYYSTARNRVYILEAFRIHLVERGGPLLAYRPTRVVEIKSPPDDIC